MKTYKERAHAIGFEWIIGSDYQVCFRPMLFDENGIRQLTYYPDPAEFEPMADAISELEHQEQNQLSALETSRELAAQDYIDRLKNGQLRD